MKSALGTFYDNALSRNNQIYFVSDTVLFSLGQSWPDEAVNVLICNSEFFYRYVWKNFIKKFYFLFDIKPA